MATATVATASPASAGSKPWYKILYIQVLIAIVLGALAGAFWPALATNEWIKALGDGFIKLIKMVIAPIIFCTVVSGIAHIQDAKKVGRIGVKALVYFEVVSTFALVIGLLIGNLVKPGAGFGNAAANAQAVAGYAKQAEAQKSVDFVLHIIPDTVVGAFAQGEILQVLLFSVLFGFAIMGLGIDKFMSECRALTNLCGNGVACVIVAWWEGELDRDKLNANLARQIDPTDMETALTTD